MQGSIRGIRCAIAMGVALWMCMGAVARAQAGGQEAGGQQPGATAPRYVRIAQGGASLLNFPDVQSSVWRVLAEGEVLRVVGEQRLELPGGEKLTFLESEAPGGLPVWVFGQYLAESENEGILRTTTSVRMRPKPTSDTSSMAHPMTLPRGERVSFIERDDPSRPMAEDWVKVWSPESARAWVLASKTEPVDSATGLATWKKASNLLRGPLLAQATAAPREAGATAPQDASSSPAAATSAGTDRAASAGGAQALLEEADATYAAAQAAEGSSDGVGATDYRDAVAAYQRALDATGGLDTPLGRTAYQHLQIAQAAADLAALRDEIAEVDAARDKRQKDLEREERLAEARNDPLWGRFMARGWISAREVGDETRYFVDWRGNEACEVICSNGRYDLELFRGFEVGVMGTTQRGPIAASADGGAQPSLLDLYRVEVISGSGARNARQ